MSNESLNDFYNQNRLNKKLRERIDAYEPELSDSLWDRIEHDLVKKENRGKRVVWMVYVMAGLLLLSGVGIYHLATENKKLADAVKEQGTQEELPLYTMPETKVEVQPEVKVEDKVENKVKVEEKIEDESQYSAGQTVPVENKFPSNSNPEARFQEVETVSVPEITPEAEGTKSNKENSIENPVAATPVIHVEGLSMSNKPAPAFKASAKKPGTQFLNNRKGKDIIPAKVQPFIGVSSEVGSNRQIVNSPNAYRFDYEHPYMFQSHGLEFGVQCRSGWFLQSGIRSTTSGTNNWYDLVPVWIDSTTPIPQRSDSIIVGNKHRVSTQSWIEIPVQIGYEFRLNSKWSIVGNTGLSYSLINKFGGVEPNQSFAAFDRAGESVPQPYKNYWTFLAGGGISYHLNRNWMINFEGQYRKGIQNFNSVQDLNHPNRKNEMLSGKLSVRYILR